MLAARAWRWSPVVHAVDGGGALCGARPRAGRWTANTRIPINCPRCLYELSRPRYAFCQSPSAARAPRHIRVLGPEGLQLRSSSGSFRTLCGMAAGWDIARVEKTPAPGNPSVCRSCVRELRSARTGLRAIA
jgi:hypothetical protein